MGAAQQILGAIFLRIEAALIAADPTANSSNLLYESPFRLEWFTGKIGSRLTGNLPIIERVNESPSYFVLLASEHAPRLFAALIAGAIIGIEGEIYHRPAGLRTNILITVGATLLSILSLVAGQTFGGDSTRIAAQIITGIGFIGAGVIMHNREQIHGITTAALIFVTAAIGMTIGYGFIWSGIAIAALVFTVLVFLRPVARAMENSVLIARLRRWQHPLSELNGVQHPRSNRTRRK